MSEVKIRERDRYTASPKEGTNPTWTEYQIVSGRRILSRHETPKAAQEALAKLHNQSPK